MQRSALIREELEDAVAGMSPAARTVFEEIEIRDENTEPEFPEDFDALTPIERISVTKAAEHLKGLARRTRLRTSGTKHTLKASPDDADSSGSGRYSFHWRA